MLLDSPVMMGYCVFVVAVLGLCMGSFLNCLAWRLTHGESVLHGRSHCTTCGHVLGLRDLVPVLSWMMSGGKCRYCGERVSARYPATEVLCALMYVSIVLRYGLSLEALELIAFASVLLVLSLTDLDDYVIPNATIVVAIVIRLLYIVVGGVCLKQFDALAVFVQSLTSGFVVAIPLVVLVVIMDHVLGRESFGGGDVKLLFVAALYFGWQQCLFLIVLACVLGLVFAMVGMRRAQNASVEEDKQRLIPFGPSIALACWITMLIGPQVLNWYLGFIRF